MLNDLSAICKFKGCFIAIKSPLTCRRFITKSPQKALLGPFGIFVHTPALGKAFQQTFLSMPKISNLPARPREIAILVVGAHFQAAYELYAHENVALKATSLNKIEILRIRSMQKADSFTSADTIAFDVAVSLISCPGPLKASLYEEAVAKFGHDATVALIHFVGFYAYLSILLNAFDEPVPEM